jgi:hypothetical protein
MAGVKEVFGEEKIHAEVAEETRRARRKHEDRDSWRVVRRVCRNIREDRP